MRNGNRRPGHAAWWFGTIAALAIVAAVTIEASRNDGAMALDAARAALGAAPPGPDAPEGAESIATDPLARAVVEIDEEVTDSPARPAEERILRGRVASPFPRVPAGCVVVLHPRGVTPTVEGIVAAVRRDDGASTRGSVLATIAEEHTGHFQIAGVDPDAMDSIAVLGPGLWRPPSRFAAPIFDRELVLGTETVRWARVRAVSADGRRIDLADGFPLDVLERGSSASSWPPRAVPDDIDVWIGAAMRLGIFHETELGPDLWLMRDPIAWTVRVQWPGCPPRTEPLRTAFTDAPPPVNDLRMLDCVPCADVPVRFTIADLDPDVAAMTIAALRPGGVLGWLTLVDGDARVLTYRVPAGIAGVWKMRNVPSGIWRVDFRANSRALPLAKDAPPMEIVAGRPGASELHVVLDPSFGFVRFVSSLPKLAVAWSPLERADPSVIDGDFEFFTAPPFGPIAVPPGDYVLTRPRGGDEDGAPTRFTVTRGAITDVRVEESFLPSDARDEPWVLEVRDQPRTVRLPRRGAGDH